MIRRTSSLYRSTLRLVTLIVIFNQIAVIGYTRPQVPGRLQTAKMIQNSKEFSNPIMIHIEDGNISLRPRSPKETEEEARARALNSYYAYTSKWSWAVLKQLGYIDAMATLIEKWHVEDAGKPWARLKPWVFKVEHFLTEKGRNEAKRFRLTDAKAVPLARKEVIAVTGITSPRRGYSSAEFIWKAVPSSVGEAFNPLSSTFKSLPQQLQDELRKSRGFGLFSGSTTVNWGEAQKSIAYFQLYDDGWRLTKIRSTNPFDL